MQPQWKGSMPQRFSGGRKILHQQNQLGLGLSFTDSKIPHRIGIRSFSPTPTLEYQFRPHQRIFQQHYNPIPKQLDLKGIKPISLPPQKQRVRPEKSHIAGGEQTFKQIDLKGIRVFQQANRSREKSYFVENQMQRKGRLSALDGMRNSIGVASLGDKSYKYPEYEKDFYKAGGLIPGATQKLRKSQVIPEIKKGTILTRPNWDQVVKTQQIQEQRRYLDSIDQWQKTILKQNNPKWNDPDTFFERQQAKDQGKDNKKAGKK